MIKLFSFFFSSLVIPIKYIAAKGPMKQARTLKRNMLTDLSVKKCTHNGMATAIIVTTIDIP